MKPMTILVVALVATNVVLAETIDTIVGGGFSAADGIPAVDAVLLGPQGVAYDSAGNLYIADGFDVRRVDAVTGIITTVAGNGTSGFSGDGGQATSAQLGAPSALLHDGGTRLFIADSGNFRVRVVDLTTGIITTFAGNGFELPSGDGGPAAIAGLGLPTDIAMDGLGKVYISTFFLFSDIRVVDTSGIINTYATIDPLARALRP